MTSRHERAAGPPHPAPPAVTIDLRTAEPAHEHARSVDLQRRLDSLASDLRVLWAAALERGDVHEASRLVDASHAVHRASLAMKLDSRLIAQRSEDGPPLDGWYGSSSM